jgi:hypothetical protein
MRPRTTEGERERAIDKIGGEVDEWKVGGER